MYNMHPSKNIITKSKDKALANKQHYIKRPTNAFIIWYHTQRQKTASANPNLTSPEISKHLGAEWKLLPIQEKQPFIDESKRLWEQHMRDHPGYMFSNRFKPESVINTLEPSVVPHSMSPCFPPNFDNQEFMSNNPVSEDYTEQRNNPRDGCIPTYDTYSTIYPDVSYDPNPRCTDRTVFPDGLSYMPPALGKETFTSNDPVSALDTENRSNAFAGCIPIYDVQSTPHESMSYDPNLQCTDSRTVVPDGLLSHILPAVCEEAFTSNAAVSALDTENRSNNFAGRIPTYDVQSTPYEPISYDPNPQCTNSRTVVPDGLLSHISPAVCEEAFTSNAPVSALDTGNRNNTFAGCMPTYNVQSTPYKSISYDPNPQCTNSRTVVPDGLLSHIPPAVCEEAFTSNASVSALDTESRCNTLVGSIPTSDMLSTPYDAVSYDPNPRCTKSMTVVPDGLSCMPQSFGEEAFMSNSPVSALDSENISNTHTGSIPTYHMQSTPFEATSNDSNPQCVKCWNLTSINRHDSQSLAAPR